MPRRRATTTSAAPRRAVRFGAARRRPPVRVLAGVATLALAGALLPTISQAVQPVTKTPTIVVRRGVTSTDLRLEPPAGLNDPVALASTSFANPENTILALRADGHVVGWGANTFGQASAPASLDDATAVDIGGGFGLALRADGSVAAWGSNASGALDVPADLGPVTAVAAGGTASPTAACGYALALTAERTVVRWGGARSDGTCRTYGSRFDPPADLTDVVAISAGSTAAMALKADGTVVAWGSGTSPYTTGIALARWKDVTAISTEGGRFIGLQSDHQALTWGFVSQAPMVPLPGDLASVSAAETSTFLSLDGSLHERGRQSDDTGSAYLAAAGGYDFTVAILAAGEPVPGAPDPTPTPTPDPTPTPEPGVTTPAPEPGVTSPAPEPEVTSPAPEPEVTSPAPEPGVTSPAPEPGVTSPAPEPGVTSPAPEPGVTTPAPEPEVTTPAPAPTDEPTVGPAPVDPPTNVLGSDEIQPWVDTNDAGTAEAFRVPASADASTTELHVYLDASSTAHELLVGVYADDDGEPGALLSSGHAARLTDGWNDVTVDSVALDRGRHYWLALAAPTGAGDVRFRDLPDGDGGPTRTSAETDLSRSSGLPKTWTNGRRYGNAPASLYLGGPAS